jgi:hypothetical protein
MADEPKDADDLGNFPPTDETGDVDLSLLDATLRLTPAQRAERHYHARLFAQHMVRARKVQSDSLGIPPAPIEPPL